MKKRNLYLLTTLLVAFIGSFITVVVLRPSVIWGSEQKLLSMTRSASPFYYNILTNGNGHHLDQAVETNDHVFALNSVHWDADKNMVCVVYSTQTPSLTVFGDAIEQSKSVGAIRLVDDAGFEYASVQSKPLGFATDAVDTVSWLTCFENIPTNIGDFTLTLGQVDIPHNHAEFTVVRPK